MSNSRLNESDYAIALMTGDDYGGLRGEGAKKRMRQNVVLELGMFMNKSRKHVSLIVEEGIEIPSDLHGMAYHPTDNWRDGIKKDLRKAGFTVNES